MDIPGFPDRVGMLEDGWAVRFNGCIQAARWISRGAADAHLELLQRGKVQPQPEEYKPHRMRRPAIVDRDVLPFHLRDRGAA